MGTLHNDQSTSVEFLEFLRRRKRTCRTVRLPDVDAFVARLRRRMGVVAVACQLCSVRALLRFLHVSGRLRFDLAGSVVRPLLKADRQPPKALPWSQVRRVLQAVDRGTRTGSRDYAILLLMSLYGLGAGEVYALRLEDINWDRKTIGICRPKTQATILLPLLPAAARALASYLQRSRPKPSPHRQVFLQSVVPHEPLTSSSTLAYMLTKYGRKAGVTKGPLGSHVLRHSQATRHIELGTPVKVVGDILGHRNPESTSRYTRSAVHRLHDLALPLPHG
jgi:integrase/recombinase XerD